MARVLPLYDMTPVTAGMPIMRRWLGKTMGMGG